MSTDVEEPTDADRSGEAFASDRSGEAFASGENPPFDQHHRFDQREKQHEELDEQTRARRDAALAHVRKLGDPVLRASAVEVGRFDERLAAEVARMGELMQDALGVGLAATQLGVLHRVLVYKAYEDDPLSALVNPVLEWESEEREVKEEGCLSLPGVHVEVERAVAVRVRARDPHGREITVEEEGLPARVIQHEIDHLNGVLILDRISRDARRDAMRALREAREADAPTRSCASASPKEHVGPPRANTPASPRAAPPAAPEGSRAEASDRAAVPAVSA
ncbi:MAG TPA: peptide deformylase [Solirubrobacteraceae bacterium]|nr:peptide deformylase [Solirubrobacteraceae bacterium]